MNDQQASDALKPVFIVGQYKCGSTWLLNILNAHPKVRGVAEIDIVRAANRVEGGQVKGLWPENDRLRRFFDTSGWCTYFDDKGWHDHDVIARFEQGKEFKAATQANNQLFYFRHLQPDAARTLYLEIKAAGTAGQAMDSFVKAVSSNAEGCSHVVLKGATQIDVFDALNDWQPDAKKIVITRDGRDASISGLHFQNLMGEMNAPIERSTLDYWGLLQHWRHSVDMVLKRARMGQLRIVRYEDLTNDFGGTMKPLLSWLGLENSDALIAEMQERSSFKRMTGRARGEGAKHVMRKGAVGEWLTTLEPEQKNKAWKLAQAQLSALGYTEDGTPSPFNHP